MGRRFSAAGGEALEMITIANGACVCKLLSSRTFKFKRIYPCQMPNSFQRIMLFVFQLTDSANCYA